MSVISLHAWVCSLVAAPTCAAVVGISPMVANLAFPVWATGLFPEQSYPGGHTIHTPAASDSALIISDSNKNFSIFFLLLFDISRKSRSGVSKIALALFPNLTDRGHPTTKKVGGLLTLFQATKEEFRTSAPTRALALQNKAEHIIVRVKGDCNMFVRPDRRLDRIILSFIMLPTPYI